MRRWFPRTCRRSLLPAEFDSLNKTFTQLDGMDRTWSQLEMMPKEEWEEEE